MADWDKRALTLHTNDYALMFHRAGGLARWHDRARSSQWCSDQVDFPIADSFAAQDTVAARVVRAVRDGATRLRR